MVELGLEVSETKNSEAGTRGSSTETCRSAAELPLNTYLRTDPAYRDKFHSSSSSKQARSTRAMVYHSTAAAANASPNGPRAE